MKPGLKGRPKKKKAGKEERLRLRKEEEEEIAALEKRLKDEKPPAGTNPLAYEGTDKEATEHQIYYPEASKFSQLPLSVRTKKGLATGGFVEMTEIQRASLPHSLVGRDVLAAAKTGSGKTLAFVVPLLEKLFRARWNKRDGLGALVISPTRELALQIFEVLRVVGKEHSLSAGLVIGGKDFKAEQERIEGMNILVCTPGRILQHMDQTAGFVCDNLQILVLDEADRILDMGFEKEVNAIVENLPPERQTLLFSATQTKSVRQLARLSLREPEYIAVHEADAHNTPAGLIQHYLVCPLQDKLNVLFSFLKSHTKTKILVFVSSCKQVRFIYETFRLLQPGLPVMSLHGKMHQMKRMASYLRFCQQNHGNPERVICSNQMAACMFATDIAARGLDFPKVDWVLQVDCPEDVPTYIHRVGRTARYNAGGRALLFLLPSEEKMAELLQVGKVPLDKIVVNPQRSMTIGPKLQGLLTQDPALKYLAQKCFISYMRSVHLQSNKEVFDVKALPAAEFAASMGLLGTPRIRFTQSKKPSKNLPFALQNVLKAPNDETESLDTERKTFDKDKPKGKMEKLITRRNATVLSETYARLRANDEAEEDDEEDGVFFKVKDAAVKRQTVQKATASQPSTELQAKPIGELKKKAAARFERIAETLRKEDEEDRKLHKQRLKEKRWAEKQKRREQKHDKESVVVLGPDDEESEGWEGEQSQSEEDCETGDQPSEEPETPSEDETVSGKRKREIGKSQLRLARDISSENNEEDGQANQKRRRRLLEEVPTNALEELALSLLRSERA